ncbi:MAG: ribonuclease III, partial [Bacillota bacterium]
VLSLVISNYLFKKFPDIPEGQLTKLRAKIVCEPSLADVAKSIELGESLKLGHGEEITGGRSRTSILADGFEAVLAAIYLDNDFKTVEKFILDIMETKINQAVSGDLLLDYKTRLQEIIQSQTTKNLNYQLYDEKGPDHNKTFYVHVMLEDKILGSGEGSNKKEAEQQAAKEAIQEVDVYE